MPVVVPDPSVLHPSPARAGHGRSHSGAGQAAGPFSDLLAGSDEAQVPAVPNRADAVDRRQSKPFAKTDRVSNRRQSSAETAKPEKSQKGAETKGDPKTQTTATAVDAEDTSVTNNGSTKPQAEIAAQTDLPCDAAAGESEPDLLLLLAAVPALDTPNAVAASQTIPVPVVAPAPPSVIIANAAPAADESAAMTEIAAGVVKGTRVAPALTIAPPLTVKPETNAPADIDIDTADPAQTAAPASKAPEAAPESSESKAPSARPEVAAKTADGRPETPVSVDAPGARTNSEPASNTSALSASAAVSAPVAAHTALATSPAGQAAPAVAVPLAGLAIEIAAKAQSGKNRFEIRLDPPELGRIHVRLDFDHDGNVTSWLIVDRPETLDLLRRDAPNLEHAFQQAGLKTSDNGLQFSLRDQSFSGRDNGGQSQPMARLVVPEDKLVAVELQRNHIRFAGLGGGVDIRV